MKVACAILSQPGPISPPRAVKTLAHCPAADLFFGDLLVGRRLHLEHKVNLERVVEIRDLQCSGF